MPDDTLGPSGRQLASLTASAFARRPVIEAVASQGPAPGHSNANKVPATGLRDPFGRRRPPKANTWFLSNKDVVRRWLRGFMLTSSGGAIVLGQGVIHPAAAAFWPFKSRPKRKAKAQKNVLVLMSNTGGGHKASAQAIEAGFKELYGDKYKFDIVDAWKDHTPRPFSNMPDTYTFLVKQPILWRMAYMSQQPRIVHKPYLWGCGNLVGKHMNDLFAHYDPDLVVSVHPLMQHIPLRILKRRVRLGLCDPISFATVVTDFTTCSNLWFSKSVTKCFVPTEFCANRAKMMGLKDAQIVKHGLPIRPAFSKPPAKREPLRRRLGLHPTLPAVLMVGGGEGMGQLETTVREIANKGTKCQVVVICGRNEGLRRRLAESQWGEAVEVHAFGFVSNMHEFMACCDAIITKAGPGTIAEALISGLPILLNGNVPCQEEGNIPYVVDSGCGIFERNPPKIASIIHKWFSDDGRELLRTMARNAKALGRPDALFKIVRDLAHLCEHPQLNTADKWDLHGRRLAPA